MDHPTFEEIVRAWALDYDDRVPSEGRERREAFIVLLGNLADHGFLKESVDSSKKEKIVRSCVNPNHRDKKKLKSWISMVVNDLEAAMLVYYGTVKIRRDVLTQEMSNKLDGMAKKAEETRALRTPDSEEDSEEDNVEEPFNLDGIPLDISSSAIPLDFSEKPKTKSDPKVVEMTDEEFDEIDGPEPIWDTELMEKLGVKLDE